jgi:ribosome-binding factor A
VSGRFRPRRVGDQIRAILAELVQQQVKDPGLGFVTVTEVRMSSDLQYATVFVSVMGDPESEAESLATLQRAAPFLRSEVGRRLRLRHTPEMRIRLDQTLAQSDRIDELLGANPETSGQEGEDVDDEAE